MKRKKFFTIMVVCILAAALAAVVLVGKSIVTVKEEEKVKSADLTYKKMSADTESKKKCLEECKRRNRERVEICNDLFNSPGSVYYHDTKWHKQCLENARTEYDNCKSTCE